MTPEERAALCSTCGRGVSLPHQPWCERVKAANERVHALRLCTLDGCDRVYKARGMCSTHYGRWHRAQLAEKAAA